MFPVRKSQTCLAFLEIPTWMFLGSPVWFIALLLLAPSMSSSFSSLPQTFSSGWGSVGGRGRVDRAGGCVR